MTTVAKYELDKTVQIILDGTTLFRIRALRSFADVKAGDLGGFIEKEENLSHEDTCWVYANSAASTAADHPVVMGEVQVKGHSVIYGSACIDGEGVIDGWCRVSGNVTLTNTYLSGKVNVSGNALVEDSVLEDETSVQGNVKLNGVRAVNFARFAGDCDVEYSLVCGNSQVNHQARVSNSLLKRHVRLNDDVHVRDCDLIGRMELNNGSGMIGCSVEGDIHEMVLSGFLRMRNCVVEVDSPIHAHHGTKATPTYLLDKAMSSYTMRVALSELDDLVEDGRICH